MIVTAAVLPASIPSPSQSSWDLGFFELRAYALCIMAGILLAVWVGNKRWLARGGEPGVIADVAVWAVPFGIVGARLYHVVTDYQLYFGDGRDPWRALQIWKGGLGIWGGVALGVLGGWIACRRRGVPLPALADAVAPGIVLAQAVGRWGNWFNQELFGKPTDLPWALEIHPDHRPAGYEDAATFHPTFLYESLWAAFVASVLIWADRRFRMGHGRVFALYVAGYTLGRGFWEYLRIDPANEIFGIRVNLWVSGLVFLAAVAYIVVSARRRPGREDPETLKGYYDDQDPFAGDAPDDDQTQDFDLPDAEAADGPDDDEAAKRFGQQDGTRKDDAEKDDARKDAASNDDAESDGGRAGQDGESGRPESEEKRPGAPDPAANPDPTAKADTGVTAASANEPKPGSSTDSSDRRDGAETTTGSDPARGTGASRRTGHDYDDFGSGFDSHWND